MWLFVEEQRSGAFLCAMLCGLVVGALYDVFRIVRAVFIAGRVRLFFDDVFFCVLASMAFTVFCFNVSLGVVRLFLALGTLFGFFIYRFSLGMLTVPLVKIVKAFISPYVSSFCRCVKSRMSRMRASRYTRFRISKSGGVIN